MYQMSFSDGIVGSNISVSINVYNYTSDSWSDAINMSVQGDLFTLDGLPYSYFDDVFNQTDGDSSQGVLISFDFSSILAATYVDWIQLTVFYMDASDTERIDGQFMLYYY